MKTKIVYVLISSDDDIYLEQAYISMFSAKYYMPDCHIVLVTDKLTSETFIGTRKNEVKYADDFIVVDLDSNKFNAQQRSRQLKTSVRNRIDGNFIFIDCDTIITKPLYDIDYIETDIAACRDTHSDFINNPYRNMCIEHGHLLGWPIDQESEYFNSGVIYVKDTNLTHEFYKRWNENLNSGYSKKVYMDQPSFAKTNYEMGHVVKKLPDIWNCELKHGVKYLKDAYIVHYLCTNPSHFQDKQFFILNEKNVLLEVKKTGEINESIKNTIKDPFYGIAELTHCFAGEDVYYFHSLRYSFFRKNWHIGKKNIIDFFLRCLNYFQIKLKYIFFAK